MQRMPYSFKDQFWTYDEHDTNYGKRMNEWYLYLYTVKNISLTQTCRIVKSLLQFSEPRRFNFSCQNCNKLNCNTIQNVEWRDTLVNTNDGRAYNEVILLLIRQMNDAEENLCTKFDVPDSSVIFCKLQHAWNGQAPLQSVSTWSNDPW